MAHLILRELKLLFSIRVLLHFLCLHWMQNYYYPSVEGMYRLKKKHKDCAIDFDRVMKLLKYFGLKMKCRARNRSQRSTSSDVSNKFEDDIRPSFIRYAISMRR